MKMQFYHIGKAWVNDIPTRPFKAVRKTVNGKKTLVPIITWLSERDKEVTPSTEFFVYGVGWGKVGKSKVYEIPLFDLEAEHWDKYVEDYGVLCLFYSLTGKSFYDQDCCLLPSYYEFTSIRDYGAVNYVDFIEKFQKVNEIQKKVLTDYISTVDNSWIDKEKWWERYKFQPCYHIYMMPLPYTPDVIEDDLLMEKFYAEKRKRELTKQHPLYPKYEGLEERLKALRDSDNDRSYGWVYRLKEADGTTYSQIDDESNLTYREISSAVDKQVSFEISEDNDAFPTNVSDRMRVLYGDECERLYHELCEKYLSNGKGKKRA